MVSTVQLKPAPILQPYISCYGLRVFNTGELEMPRPMHAVHEYYLTFFLGDKFCVHGKLSNVLTSLFTESQGCTYWKGNYALFHVQIKCNGLFAIFGIPQKILINTIVPLEDILGNECRQLTEQLESSKDIYEMSVYMNSYLTKMLLCQRHKMYTITITNIANIIFRNSGIVSLDTLVHYANMSFRNFERRFVEEVGLSPKLYARITRFYNALENKMLNPSKRWIDITYQYGYFDQAHFIKEVKTFSSKTPEELFKYTPPPTEDFITKVEH
jgi:AraC-like DNA-binding protein